MDPSTGSDLPPEDGEPAVAPHRREVVPGLQPFWTFVAGWSVLCGTFASNSLRWDGAHLFALSIIFLLVTAGWNAIWSLVIGGDWASLLQRVHGRLPNTLWSLPYTRPGSPADRLGRGLGRLVGWREALWPAGGSSCVVALLALVLVVVLSLLLPPRILWLDLAMVAVIALGAMQQRHGHPPVGTQSLLYLGLPWLAGNLALARFRWHAVLLALLFSLSAWGTSRMAQGERNTWRLHGGLLVVGGVLVMLGHPLAAGVVVLLGFGALLPSLALRFGGKPPTAAWRVWPWLLAAMLVASLLGP